MAASWCIARVLFCFLLRVHQAFRDGTGAPAKQQKMRCDGVTLPPEMDSTRPLWCAFLRALGRNASATPYDGNTAADLLIPKGRRLHIVSYARSRSYIKKHCVVYSRVESSLAGTTKICRLQYFDAALELYCWNSSNGLFPLSIRLCLCASAYALNRGQWRLPLGRAKRC